mmetsp:Transcript_125436/g.401719  ORF Transcript_125436/g.401719 Transcript_125436/m.401719 type:complete len:269 (+) Transcript_125436:1481-2287(+)
MEKSLSCWLFWSSTARTSADKSLIFASQSLRSILRSSACLSTKAFAVQACSNSRLRRSCSALCSCSPASRELRCARCCATSSWSSALLRISASYCWRTISSSLSKAACRSSPILLFSDNCCFRSSMACRCASCSRDISCSNSWHLLDASSWVCCSDFCSASFCVSSKLSRASSEPFVWSNDSRSFWVSDKVALSCSMYSRWASKRLSSSVTRSWRIFISPSSCAERMLVECLSDSRASRACFAASSNSESCLRAASRSAVMRSNAESR